MERLSSVSTAPLDITGSDASSVDGTVAAELPDGVSLVGRRGCPAPGHHRTGRRARGRGRWASSCRVPVPPGSTRCRRPRSRSPWPARASPRRRSTRLPSTHMSRWAGWLPVRTRWMSSWSPIEGLELVSVAPAVVRVEVADGRADRPVPSPSTCPSHRVADDPTVRHRWHPGHRQRRPEADRSRIALGRATASQLLAGTGRLLVGQDTRRSGDMLVAATRVRRDVAWAWTCIGWASAPRRRCRS